MFSKLSYIFQNGTFILVNYSRNKEKKHTKPYECDFENRNRIVIRRPNAGICRSILTAIAQKNPISFRRNVIKWDCYIFPFITVIKIYPS